jgi:predicted DNA binding protein
MLNGAWQRDEAMRRLVIEVSRDELVGREAAAMPWGVMPGKLKSLEMIHILKMLPGEFAAIARVEMKDPSFKVEEVFRMLGLQDVKLELLDRENEAASTYYLTIKTKVQPGAKQLERLKTMPYLSTPFEFRDGKLRVTFLGTSPQIKKQLGSLSRVLTKQRRFHYRVVSLTDAKFPPNSPLGRLTEKQRRVLITAYKLGYYDVPRKITSEELARRLNLVKSTFSAHVRKAERRLLTEMLSEF